MQKPSLTASDSFQLRIQRSEITRSWLMCGVYGAVLAITLLRRLLGGVVMTDNMVFVPYVCLLAVALAYECFVLAALRRASRQSAVIDGWRMHTNCLFETLIPAGLLLIAHFWSPRGEYAALSSPMLLLFPITIVLSILRLKPRAPLLMGLGAAAVHAALVLNTIRTEDLDLAQLPVLFTYPLLLAVTGVAAMLVSGAARRYVSEAVEEAELRERTGLTLAAVERDLEVARDIQRRLLPADSPAFPGFEIAAMNIPAQQTGGDYYDWQRLPDGRLLVLAADVTGHGIGPALVMAVCRAYARASAPIDSNPTFLLERLNAFLYPDMMSGRFVTIAMAVLDEQGNAELVSAGHGPSLLYRSKDNDVVEFGGDGLPLAIELAETYGPSRRFEMHHGDILVLLTDGVFEWQDAIGKQFGTQRLRQTLAQAADRSAADIVEAIHAAATGHANGSPQEDDITIVVIKRSA